MTKILSRCSLFVVGAAMAASSVASAAASPAPHQWHLPVRLAPTKTVSDSVFNDVDALSSTNVWAVGALTEDKTGAAVPLVERRGASAWHRFPAPPVPRSARNGATLQTVQAEAPDDVWVSGYADFGRGGIQGSFVARWNGRRWVEHNFGKSWNLAHLAVFGPRDVWALGDIDRCCHTQPVIAHWNGKRWRTGTSASLPTYEQPSTVSPGWAPAIRQHGSTWTPDLLQFAGGRWRSAELPQIAVPNRDDGFYFDGVLDQGNDDRWLVVGYDRNEGQAPGLSLYHQTAAGWRRVRVLADDVPDGSIASDPGHGLWVATYHLTNGRGDLVHLASNGRILRRVEAPRTASQRLAIAAFDRIPGTAKIVAVGSHPTPTSDMAAIGILTP